MARSASGTSRSRASTTILTNTATCMWHEPHESPAVVWIPLVALAIPSVVIGYMTIGPMLFGDFFKDSIFIDLERHPAHGRAEEGLPRRLGDGRAFADIAAAVARDCRRGRRLVLSIW